MPVKSNCSPHDAITVVLRLLLRSYSCSDGAIGAVSEMLESSVFPFQPKITESSQSLRMCFILHTPTLTLPSLAAFCALSLPLPTNRLLFLKLPLFEILSQYFLSARIPHFLPCLIRKDPMCVPLFCLLFVSSPLYAWSGVFALIWPQIPFPLHVRGQVTLEVSSIFQFEAKKLQSSTPSPY